LVVGDMLADPVLAVVHQRRDPVDVRAAFGVGEGPLLPAMRLSGPPLPN
jgi:hypothetical protein